MASLEVTVPQQRRTATATVHNRTFSLEELQVLNKTKRKKTTDGYFAVILLKNLTNFGDRVNCTVYGEGKKSKGLDPHILTKIKGYYTTLYKDDTWNDQPSQILLQIKKKYWKS